MLNTSSLVILTIICFGLTGCGGSDSNTTSPISVEVPIETPVEDVTPPVVDEGEDTTSVEDKANDENNATSPNILFILSDDQGLDASAQYDLSEDIPNTPTLNTLAEQGLTFDNMWVTPACSTTRGTIITGKYGVNNGVESLPADLSADHEIIQQYLKRFSASEKYKSAVFGKWHLGGSNDYSHPNNMGVDHYAGNLSNLSDYYDWPLTINGVANNSTEYHSTKITDLAIDWMSAQTTPWFAWVAYSAPHSPFHLPPKSLHSRDLSGEASDIDNNKREYYLAAIEAMDSEIGRLLDALDDNVRHNTIIIFMGDNGTPKGVIDTSIYSKNHAKGTLYQGGISVPFIVSGKSVSRINERELALVTATDLYATIAEIAGVTETKVHDSKSFKALFTDSVASSKEYIYTAFKSEEVTGWATRSNEYKLITFDDGSQELYALTGGFSELSNLLPTNDENLQAKVQDLTTVSSLILGSEPFSPIDLTNIILTNKSKNCVDYIEKFTSTVNDINNSTVFYGDLVISKVGDKCIFNTNAIPNHDFNDGGRAFPNKVSEQNDQFEITISPTIASTKTAISLQVDNAILLNGVKVDLLAAGCFGVGNGKIGCNDMSQPWRYDPMHAENGFAVDSHNAHAQPDGTYHYHGTPVALFDDNTNDKSPVIGFAADGFPIYGSIINIQGEIRRVKSSFRLKQGDRPSGNGEPGGRYDGTFRDDYEYVEGLGDLDECNGMTIDGGYGYYTTDTYPYVLACFSGTPDSSFIK